MVTSVDSPVPPEASPNAAASRGGVRRNNYVVLLFVSALRVHLHPVPRSSGINGSR